MECLDEINYGFKVSFYRDKEYHKQPVNNPSRNDVTLLDLEIIKQ